jgi:hypothetical protein
MLMIGQYRFGMGQNSMAPGTPAPGGNGTPGLRLVLRLYGVSDANGLVTSTGNRLIFQGQLTTPAGSKTPIVVDQAFVLNGGSALVQAPLNLPSLTGPATITIDQIIVADDGGSAFAVPGIALIQPTPQFTPGPTPGVGCTHDSDCDDGNPDTRDLCMPMGCVHMPGHMGMSGQPMM